MLFGYALILAVDKVLFDTHSTFGNHDCDCHHREEEHSNENDGYTRAPSLLDYKQTNKIK